MHAKWFAANRILTAKLEIQWDRVNWTDETSRLMRANGRVAVPDLWSATSAAFKPGRATFTVRSPSDRFSPYNTTGPLYPYIGANGGYGIPLRFSVAVMDDAGIWQWERLFTGYIDRLSLTSLKYNRTRIEAIDGSQPYLQTKRSTTVQQNQTPAEWIAYLAALAGITDVSIDAGLDDIPFCWLDDENVLDEMLAAARAEGGFICFDRNGTLVFRGAQSFLTRSEYATARHTFTVSNMREAQAAWDWTTVYNSIIVPYSPRGIGSAGTVLYALTRPFAVNAGETITITARHKYPALNVDTLTDATILTGAGDDISSDVTISVTSYAQHSDIAITNNHAYHTANVLTLSLTGTPILGRKSEQVEQTATGSVIGDPATNKKSFPMALNPYIQTRRSAAGLASMLIGRLVSLRGKYTIDAPALPALEAYHRVTVVDGDSGINRDALITGIVWQFNKGAFTATYDAVEAGNWYVSADNPGYLLVGTDSPGDGKVLFY